MSLNRRWHLPQSLHPKNELRFCAEAPRESSCALFVGGQQLNEQGRLDTLKRLRDGDIIELELEAVTYIQRPTPNRNFVRFDKKILTAFAKSFTGQPFLADHASYSLASRGGTILASKAEKTEDGAQFRQRLQLVKPWAVEGALDGTIDRFSIGWSRTAAVICSIHGGNVFRDCDCYPGAKADGKNEGKVVEFVFTGADGTEVSGVNVPAVVGTGIESITQLAALDRATLAGILGDETIATPPERKNMDPKILAALNLPSNATADDVAAAIAKLNESRTVDAAVAANNAARLAAIEVEQKLARSTTRKTLVDATVSRLVAAGKIKPLGDVEVALRSSASRDLADDRDPSLFLAQSKELLDSGARVTPVGTQLPAEGADPVLAHKPGVVLDGKEYLASNPGTAGWLKRAGITQEQFEKHGAGARERIAALNH